MAYSLLTGLDQGLLWAILALGVYISFRTLDFADLTCEGSFAFGGAVSAVMIYDGSNAILSCIVALLAGAAAGLVTGILNTKFRIPPILAGILTLTGLYSINYITMKSRASIGLANKELFYSWIKLDGVYSMLIAGIIIVAIVIGVMYWFFGTQLGSAIRATGANEKMCRAQGINTDNTKIIGLILSNALIALSGALVAQQQGSATLTMGTGAIVIGLAAVIIGETVIPAKNSFLLTLISIVVGSIIYRIIITLVFFAGLDTEYIKLVTAVLVVIALCLPLIKEKVIKARKWMDANWIKYPWYAKHVEKREARKARRAKRKAARVAAAEAKAAAVGNASCNDMQTDDIQEEGKADAASANDVTADNDVKEENGVGGEKNA